MDRQMMLELVATARREGLECERRLLGQRAQIASLRAAGADTRDAELALSEIEAAYDALLSTMGKLLDELDKQADSPSAEVEIGTHSRSQRLQFFATHSETRT